MEPTAGESRGAEVTSVRSPDHDAAEAETSVVTLDGFGPTAPAMLVRRDGGSWRRPEIDGYRALAASAQLLGEQALQKLLADSPELLGLPGAAVARELPVPDTGSLDLACVDASGAITLVECKLKDNAEIRRTVVGQVLAYGAGLWRLSYEEFEHRFTKCAERPLIEAARREVAIEDWDDDAFRGAVTANLAAGRFDLVIAVDAVTDELKRIVRYLNEHTVPEMRVLALELGYARDGDLEILVPAIYGHEVKPAPGGPAWDEDKLFATLVERCPEGVRAVKEIYEHAVARGASFSWGKGPLPAVTATFDVDGAPARIWTCQTHETPNIAINFDWIRGVVPKENLSRFAERVQTIPGAAARLHALEEAGWRKRPGLPIVEVLSNMGAPGTFCKAIDELIGREVT